MRANILVVTTTTYTQLNGFSEYYDQLTWCVALTPMKIALHVIVGFFFDWLTDALSLYHDHTNKDKLANQQIRIKESSALGVDVNLLIGNAKETL